MEIARTSHLLVTAQLACVALCCYPPGWQNHGSPWWLALCLVGGVLGVAVLYCNRPGNFSVYPEIRENAVLVTNGPYRYVRHPMYSALILMMVGIAGYNGTPTNQVATVVLIVVVATKALREERLLPQVFPQYPAYAMSTKRFVPFLL